MVYFLITCHFAEILKFGVRRFVPEAIDMMKCDYELGCGHGQRWQCVGEVDSLKVTHCCLVMIVYK